MQPRQTISQSASVTPEEMQVKDKNTYSFRSVTCRDLGDKARSNKRLRSDWELTLRALLNFTWMDQAALQS